MLSVAEDDHARAPFTAAISSREGQPPREIVCVVKRSLRSANEDPHTQATTDPDTDEQPSHGMSRNGCHHIPGLMGSGEPCRKRIGVTGVNDYRKKGPFRSLKSHPLLR